MTTSLRSTTTRRTRAVVLAAVSITLLVAGPAAAGCSPLDELPAVGVPAVPEVPGHVGTAS